MNGLDPPAAVSYWRDRGKEVDFVVERGRRLTAFEVKSGPAASRLPGLLAFSHAHPVARTQLVGGDGIPLEDLLGTAADVWVA